MLRAIVGSVGSIPDGDKSGEERDEKTYVLTRRAQTILSSAFGFDRAPFVMNGWATLQSARDLFVRIVEAFQNAL
jgi:hypothetical protein